jgi:hypothetical protein
MREHNEYMARAAVCEQRAKEARTESEKESWLVMADSWRETVKLQEMLTRHCSCRSDNDNGRGCILFALISSRNCRRLLNADSCRVSI